MSLSPLPADDGSSSASSVEGCLLWYVPTMPSTTPPTRAVDVPTPPRPAPPRSRPPLSVIHAKALYRPVPPVDCDDDGYPYCDGSAVESTDHWDSRSYLVQTVRSRFLDRDDVFAAADLGFYFERGKRSALVVPDAMVVFGVGTHSRLSYKLWEELEVPDLVLEVVSKYSWRKDVHDKPPLYAALGVREYWLFDPLDQRRDGGPRLEGWRLGTDGSRTPLPPCATGDGFESVVLGLDVLLLDREMRLRDPDTGETLPDWTESEAKRRSEAARAQAEAARADEQAARADEQAARADEQAARADEETAKRMVAERRIAELEARLRLT